MTAERQEPGVEWLAALARLEEQLDPVLCEFLEGRGRCGHTAQWHARTQCHPDRGEAPFVCPTHKARIDGFLEHHRMRCAHCGAVSGVNWTEL